MAENIHKVKRSTLREIFTPLKTQYIANYLRFPIQKQVNILLPVPAGADAGLISDGVTIDDDGDFYCKYIYIIYSGALDVLNATPEFTRFKLSDAGSSRQFTRDWIDVRAVGSRGQYANQAAVPKDLYHTQTPIKLDYIFKESGKINIDIQYHHNSAITEFVTFVFRGPDIRT